MLGPAHLYINLNTLGPKKNPQKQRNLTRELESSREMQLMNEKKILQEDFSKFSILSPPASTKEALLFPLSKPLFSISLHHMSCSMFVCARAWGEEGV